MKLLESPDQLETHIIYILLLRSGKYTFLPELLDVVGREKMVELLQLFAGMQFKFPATSEIEKYAKEVTIFFRVHRAMPKQRASVVKDLADEYFVDEDTINLAYRKIAHLIKQDLQLKL